MSEGLISCISIQGDRKLILSCLLGMFGTSEFERMTTLAVKVVMSGVVFHSSPDVFLTIAQKISLHSTKLPFHIRGTVHTKEVTFLMTIYSCHCVNPLLSCCRGCFGGDFKVTWAAAARSVTCQWMGVVIDGGGVCWGVAITEVVAIHMGQCIWDACFSGVPRWIGTHTSRAGRRC